MAKIREKEGQGAALMEVRKNLKYIDGINQGKCRVTLSILLNGKMIDLSVNEKMGYRVVLDFIKEKKSDIRKLCHRFNIILDEEDEKILGVSILDKKEKKRVLNKEIEKEIEEQYKEVSQIMEG